MTNIKYETEIIRVLHAAGQEGLSVQKISLHVRNACSSLFEPLDMEEVHRYVQAWLVRNVKGFAPWFCVRQGEECMSSIWSRVK